jgi:two-component system, OmpR family, alkaline phosphatase synthesis response regulator PhoP
VKTQILLVDDEEHMLRLLQFVLKPIPASIHCVKSGDAAVEFFKANHPNLVLLDYAMPGMDGVETLRQIRAQECGSAVPVIMLTARDQTVIRKEAAGLHIHAFLTKPFSPSDLVRRAREFQGAKGARCREMRHETKQTHPGTIRSTRNHLEG